MQKNTGDYRWSSQGAAKTISLSLSVIQTQPSLFQSRLETESSLVPENMEEASFFFQEKVQKRGEKRAVFGVPASRAERVACVV